MTGDNDGAAGARRWGGWGTGTRRVRDNCGRERCGAVIVGRHARGAHAQKKEEDGEKKSGR